MANVVGMVRHSGKIQLGDGGVSYGPSGQLDPKFRLGIASSCDDITISSCKNLII